jgi:hypothetical protein
MKLVNRSRCIIDKYNIFLTMPTLQLILDSNGMYFNNLIEEEFDF